MTTPTAADNTPTVAARRDAVERALAMYFSSGRQIMHGWTPGVRRVDDDVRSAGYSAVGRAIDGMHNSGWLAGVIDVMSGLMVGTGLTLNADPDAESLGWSAAEKAAWCRPIERRWKTWAGNPLECDAAGRMTIAEMCAAQIRTFYAHGETLATIESLSYVPGGTLTKVNLLDPASLPRSTVTYNADQGIRCNEYGLPIEFVFRIRDADKQLEQERIVPARTPEGRELVLHQFIGMPGQRRGITPLAPALRVVRQYDQLADATLTATLIQTIFAATVKSNMGPEQVLEALQVVGEGAGEVTETAVGKYLTEAQSWYKNSRIDLGEHGRIAQLFPGEELVFHRSEHPMTSYNDFANHLLREIARCIPCTFETFTGNYQSATYSSVRMATSEHWPIIVFRRQAIAARFCQSVYDAWLEEQIARELVPFPGGYEAFVANRAAVTRARWRGPARPTADDEKTANASRVKLESGLSTLEQECAELGMDYEDLMEQRARELAMMQQRGLALPWMMEAAPAGSEGQGPDPAAAAGARPRVDMDELAEAVNALKR